MIEFDPDHKIAMEFWGQISQGNLDSSPLVEIVPLNSCPRLSKYNH